MLQELLLSPDWQRVQALWLRLQCFFDVPQASPDWSLLRVWMDRELNLLQRLVLKKQLSPSQAQHVQQLFQHRFDQLLQSFYRQKSTPYTYLPTVPRGPFTRYQALGDLEQAFFEWQKKLRLPQVPQRIRDRVLHDLNFEVVERYAHAQTAEDRGLSWSQALELVVWLSWSEQNLVLDFPELAMNDLQVQELALRALKSSGWVSVQCCAIRLLARSQSLALQYDCFLPLFKDAHTPEAVLLEILSVWQPDPRWENALLQTLKSETPSRHQLAYTTLQQVLSCWLQLPDPQERLLLHQLLQSPQLSWPAVLTLSAWQALARTSGRSRPCEEYPEAYDAVLPLLQQAVLQDHSGLLQEALVTVTLLRDPRFVPVLQAILNGQYRQHSLFEKMGGGFVGERQGETALILNALEQLGCVVSFDERTGKWSLSSA